MQLFKNVSGVTRELAIKCFDRVEDDSVEVWEVSVKGFARSAVLFEWDRVADNELGLLQKAFEAAKEEW